MSAGRSNTHMSTIPRRRTRSQWDEFYRNYHNKLKRQRQLESGGEDKTVVKDDVDETMVWAVDDDGRQSNVSVGLEKFVDSGNLAKSSDESVDSSESESSSEEEEEYFSDDDYEVDDVPLSPDDHDSDESYCSDEVRGKDGECDSGGQLKGEDEKSLKATDVKKTLATRTKGMRMHEKNICDNEQEVDDEGFNGDRDDTGCWERCTNQEQKERIKSKGADSAIKKHLQLCTIKSQKVELAKSSSPVPIQENGKSTSDMDDTGRCSRYESRYHIECILGKDRQSSKKTVKLGSTKSRAARNLDLISILVKSINSLKDKHSPIEEDTLTQLNLPLKFKFEDEVDPPPEKSEWEKHVDSLFCDLELGLRESEIDCSGRSVIEKDEIISPEIDNSPAACCGRGEHETILDEEIGIVCKHCTAVILEIKYVLPPFHTLPLRRRDRIDFDESPSSVIDQSHFQESASGSQDYMCKASGTVWDLIPGVRKDMYPHQREGFEFIWRNIAGDININNLSRPLSSKGRGCIISHAPGTGKTRLTIVFLLTFLKMYPTCRPVIIAPRGMLLTWESEFTKWGVNIPFHNLNKKELSGNENAIAANVIGQLGGRGMNRGSIRLVKLYSWVKGRSILGISYRLFEELAGENEEKGQNEQIKKLLIESPGLLVLDEGHTPRNDQSLMWNTLTKVATQRRIILSGTPFQNNLTELYNTLCLVNPKFVNQIVSANSLCSETCGRKGSMSRKKWTNLTSTIGENGDDGRLKKLRAMLDPFVHVHKGTILEEHLPGLKNTLVFLHPTELQKTLLENASKAPSLFHRVRLVSLVSVHPSLMSNMRKFSVHKSKLKEIESDIDAGVKAKFVIKLIYLAGALKERVLVFSQFIDPLVFLKKGIKSHFSWNEGREVLYMDGNLDEKQRQDSISSFNDDSSEAKVLLASERACSEGINLVGASRVVLLDTVWNPSVEKQAICRAYRLGQKRVVHVYRLFTSGTEVGQYAQQMRKQRMSRLIFAPVAVDDGQTCQSDSNNSGMLEDKILEAMVNLEGFGSSIEKIIHQPKDSDLLGIFGLVEGS